MTNDKGQMTTNNDSESTREQGKYALEVKGGGHLDQMLRQTRAHHVQLSSMADVKANMMITLASLVITFSARYVSDPILRWPAFALILFCFGTVLAAAYAAMPKVDLHTKPDKSSPFFNPLFFGSFINMDFEEYLAMMEELVQDPSTVYEMQVREVYQMGVFLGRKKYLYIRYAYQIFVTGLVVSALIFLLVEARALQG